MSCVDAAIIKALVEHVGMDPEDVELGGHQCVEYTAGDAIALEDNQIHVKFNADMFEINDNELCLKSGGSGGGTIDGVSIALDDLIPVTDYYGCKVTSNMSNDGGDIFYAVTLEHNTFEQWYKPELGWVLRRKINGGFQTLVCTHINTKPAGSGITEEYEFTAGGGTIKFVLKYTTENRVLIPQSVLGSNSAPDHVTTGFFRLRQEATGANTLRGLLSNILPAFQKLSERIAALEKA